MLTAPVSRTLAGLAIVVLAVAGCTSRPGQTTPPAPTSSTSQNAALHPTPSKPTPETLTQYQNSTQRLARIYAAVKDFGMVVLSQSRTDGHWEPFDAYCSNFYEGGANPGGYTSQGYKPLPGDDCDVQHNPQYGGLDMHVEADVRVGRAGAYTHMFVRAAVTTSACTVVVSYNKGKQHSKYRSWPWPTTPRMVGRSYYDHSGESHRQQGRRMPGHHPTLRRSQSINLPGGVTSASS